MKKLAIVGLQLAVLLFLICGQAWADTKRIEGTTNMDDAGLRSNDADANNGAATYARVGYENSGDIRHAVVRVKNVASELGENATITACVCSLYITQTAIYTYDIYAYRIFKPWTETGATWNDWVTTDYEWGTAGCMNADDGGSDNSGDGTGADRKETAESSVEFNGDELNTWQAWSVSAELAQAWYDETANEEGLLFRTTATEDGYRMIFLTTEHTDDPTKCPHFTFTYTTDGDGVDKPRKNIMSGGIVR